MSNIVATDAPDNLATIEMVLLECAMCGIPWTGKLIDNNWFPSEFEKEDPLFDICLKSVYPLFVEHTTLTVSFLNTTFPPTPVISLYFTYENWSLSLSATSRSQIDKIIVGETDDIHKFIEEFSIGIFNSLLKFIFSMLKPYKLPAIPLEKMPPITM